jgi:hypothetical protein
MTFRWHLVHDYACQGPLVTASLIATPADKGGHQPKLME